MKFLSVAIVATRTILAVMAYTFKDKGGKRRRNRDSKLLGFRDAILGRWGEMGEDVRQVCYPDTKACLHL